MVRNRFTHCIAVAVCVSLLSACTSEQMYENSQVKEANVTDRTRAGSILTGIPAPSEKVAVALYDFQDQTGQFKNNDKFTDYSSAVTKGGHAILTKALLDAGNRRWFTVTERGGLKDLLQERSIIKVMRNEYHPGGEQLPPLPPLVYGGMLIEGGIVSYDSNIITGGAGAIYLGIGGNVQYHRDLVTVYLRAVSIQTGEVLLSVTSSKTIFSTSVDSNVLKYITFDRLLQAEAGFTVNEPTQLCVRQAIETAVYSMIMEGAIDKFWDFQDQAAGQRAIAEYTSRRDGTPQPPPMAAVEPAPTVEPAPAPQAALKPAAGPSPMATMQAVPVQAVAQTIIAAPARPLQYAQVIQQAQAIQQAQYNQQRVAQPVNIPHTVQQEQQQQQITAQTAPITAVRPVTQSVIVAAAHAQIQVEVMPMSAQVTAPVAPQATTTRVVSGTISGTGRNIYAGDGT